jgi:hypothetical protein
MPHLPHSIELHDSRIAAIRQDCGATKICLRPAYIHRDGKGWNQDVDILIGASTVREFNLNIRLLLMTAICLPLWGRITIFLNCPLYAPGPMNLELEFFSGSIVRIVGESVEVVLLGVPVFIENVS